jgi:hypothetical protein
MIPNVTLSECVWTMAVLSSGLIILVWIADILQTCRISERNRINLEVPCSQGVQCEIEALHKESLALASAIKNCIDWQVGAWAYYEGVFRLINKEFRDCQEHRLLVRRTFRLLFYLREAISREDKKEVDNLMLEVDALLCDLATRLH